MPNINIISTFNAGGDFDNVNGLVLFRLTEEEQQRLVRWAAVLHPLIHPEAGADCLTSARIEGLSSSHFVATHLTQDDINGDEFPELPEALMSDEWLRITDEYYEKLLEYILDEQHHLLRFRHERFIFGTYGVALVFCEKHKEHLDIEPNFRIDYDLNSGLLRFPEDIFNTNEGATRE